MESNVVKLSPEEYTQTNTGNKIFKNAFICGSQNIVINGKSILMRESMLRGDIGAIRMGKYCFIGERVIIRPGQKKFSMGATMLPIHIGDCVIIEDDVVSLATQIGSYSLIGKGSIIGRSSILKECCRVEPGTVIPVDSVFPPFSIIAGNPGRVVGSVPDCMQDIMTEEAKSVYERHVISR